MTASTDILLRKQPKQRRACATFNWVLDATEDVLCKRGVVGFNTNVVAERAGVSVGSLYQYFPNKLSIAASVWERHVAQQVQIVEAAVVDPEIGLATCLDRIIDHAVDLHARRTSFHSALRALTAPLGAPLWFANLMERRNDAFHRLFKAHEAELALNDLRLASVVCAEAIRCLSNSETLYGSGEPPEAIKQAIRSMVLTYLYGGPSSGALGDQVDVLSLRRPGVTGPRNVKLQ